MARIFVISDTHFGHENMYKFTYRPYRCELDEQQCDAACRATHPELRVRPEFTSSAEADTEMVRRWNAVVRPEDHVYHLGDVCMDTSHHLALVPHLLGHKRLILGNHDKGKMSEYHAAGFQKIFGSRHFEGFILTHIPVHPFGLRGAINVHGHTHQTPPYDSKYRNVSVERIDYTPVLLESLR